MPVVKVTAKSSGKIRVFINQVTVIPGSGQRELPSGATCRVSWDVTGKGSSYEVHVTAPAHAKRDREVQSTTKPIVVGGFAPFTV